jgi:hypothetical protein
MRSLWFMPMTFLAGIHGFAYFVPYLLLVSAIAMVIRMRQARHTALAPARAIVLELESAAT